MLSEHLKKTQACSPLFLSVLDKDRNKQTLCQAFELFCIYFPRLNVQQEKKSEFSKKKKGLCAAEAENSKTDWPCIYLFLFGVFWFFFSQTM